MARYRNASELLPPHLLKAVQAYAAGMQVYIPRPAGRAPWGQRSGAREALARRNQRIRDGYRLGATIEELMAEYHLGYDSIRKIVSGKNSSTRRRG